jgi:hypothetical protein
MLAAVTFVFASRRTKPGASNTGTVNLKNSGYSNLRVRRKRANHQRVVCLGDEAVIQPQVMRLDQYEYPALRAKIGIRGGRRGHQREAARPGSAGARAVPLPRLSLAFSMQS